MNRGELNGCGFALRRMYLGGKSDVVCSRKLVVLREHWFGVRFNFSPVQIIADSSLQNTSTRDWEENCFFVLRLQAREREAIQSRTLSPSLGW